MTSWSSCRTTDARAGARSAEETVVKKLRRLQLLAITGSLLLALPAAAAQFPVSGTLGFGGDAIAVPAGAAFGDSSYDAGTGELSTGTFSFPDITVSRSLGVLGTLVVTAALTQTNTAMGLVDTAGNAVLTSVDMQVHIISAELQTILGSTPINVGSSCDFAPISWDALGGTASVAGLDVAQASFAVPETLDACGGYAEEINAALAGGDGAVTLHLAGSFPPPEGTGGDVIFADGFDGG